MLRSQALASTASIGERAHCIASCAPLGLMLTAQGPVSGLHGDIVELDAAEEVKHAWILEL